MLVAHITQRTLEWKEWRDKGIGASECAAVLNMSKYKTPHKIWELKTHRAFHEPINEDMQRGIDLEDEARHRFQEIKGNMFLPLCGENEQWPEVRASFDGVRGDLKEFVEIKCPRRTSKLYDVVCHKDVELFKETYPDYWVQIQHQYAVNDHAEMGYMAAYIGEGKLAHMEVPKDVDFIEQKLMPELHVFWCEHVFKDKEPPLSDKDFFHVSDDVSLVDAQEWIYINQRIKEMQEREKELRKRLIDRGEGNNVIVGNLLKVTSYTSTRVDYRKACEDNSIDTNSYKKVSSPSYRFTPIVQK